MRLTRMERVRNASGEGLGKTIVSSAASTGAASAASAAVAVADTEGRRRDRASNGTRVRGEGPMDDGDDVDDGGDRDGERGGEESESTKKVRLGGSNKRVSRVSVSVCGGCQDVRASLSIDKLARAAGLGCVVDPLDR